MKSKIGELRPEAERWLPENEPDVSGVGINYADAVLKAINVTLDDGRKVTCKRRGLKLTLKIGDAKGEGLLRRLEHGPAVLDILAAALDEAAVAVDARCFFEGSELVLELP